MLEAYSWKYAPSEDLAEQVLLECIHECRRSHQLCLQTVVKRVMTPLPPEKMHQFKPIFLSKQKCPACHGDLVKTPLQLRSADENISIVIECLNEDCEYKKTIR